MLIIAATLKDAVVVIRCGNIHGTVNKFSGFGSLLAWNLRPGKDSFNGQFLLISERFFRA